MVAKYSGTQAADGSMFVTLTDGAGNLQSASAGVVAGSTSLSASSGNVAAATAAATLTGAASLTTYITGFQVTGGGATAASTVNVTVTGLLGGTATYAYGAELGAAVPNKPLIVAFYPPLPASAANTSIVVSCPTLGAGNLLNTVNVQGYRL